MSGVSSFSVVFLEEMREFIGYSYVERGNRGMDGRMEGWRDGGMEGWGDGRMRISLRA